MASRHRGSERGSAALARTWLVLAALVGFLLVVADPTPNFLGMADSPDVEHTCQTAQLLPNDFTPPIATWAHPSPTHGPGALLAQHPDAAAIDHLSLLDVSWLRLRADELAATGDKPPPLRC
jgi:hypothetical protein